MDEFKQKVQDLLLPNIGKTPKEAGILESLQELYFAELAKNNKEAFLRLLNGKEEDRIIAWGYIYAQCPLHKITKKRLGI